MSNSDLDPDCTMADDVVLIIQESQDAPHQEDSQDDMPEAKKAKSHKKSALDILLGSEDNSGSFGVRSLHSHECGLYEATNILLGEHLY